MKVQVGVGGRFHADQMMRALLGAGHDARLFTTFPRSRFPELPSDRVRSFLLPEVAFRLLRKVGPEALAEDLKMRAFGRALASAVRHESADLFLGWSSFCLETLKGGHARRTAVVRDSAHISFQMDVLRRESKRWGVPFRERPALEAREVEEYERADAVVLPSEFARRTFLERGFAPSKLRVLSLAVDVGLFHPPEDLEVRLPLRVIYFGSVSLRKGVLHLLEAVRGFRPEELSLTVVGAVMDGLGPRLRPYTNVRWLPPMKHGPLADELRRHHAFVFPTLEDGFGLVLPQALASGLASVATDACGAGALILPGENGERVPAADSAALEQVLRRWVASPVSVAALRAKAVTTASQRQWSDYARDVGALAESVAQGHSTRRA